MSYTTIYKINSDGALSTEASARNSNGFAMLVWTAMGEAYRMPFDLFAGMFGHPGGEVLIWKAFATGQLTEDDDIVLGSTFDRVWVRQDGLKRYSAALRAVYAKYGTGKVDTLLQIADIVDGMAAENGRGVAIMTTSLSDNLWFVKPTDLTAEERVAVGYSAEPDGEGYEEYVPYDFARDAGKNRSFGKEPWELFAALEGERPGFKLDSTR